MSSEIKVYRSIPRLLATILRCASFRLLVSVLATALCVYFLTLSSELQFNGIQIFFLFLFVSAILLIKTILVLLKSLFQRSPTLIINSEFIHFNFTHMPQFSIAVRDIELIEKVSLIPSGELSKAFISEGLLITLYNSDYAMYLNTMSEYNCELEFDNFSGDDYQTKHLLIPDIFYAAKTEHLIKKMNAVGVHQTIPPSILK